MSKIARREKITPIDPNHCKICKAAAPDDQFDEAIRRLNVSLVAVKITAEALSHAGDFGQLTVTSMELAGMLDGVADDAIKALDSLEAVRGAR